MRPQKYDCTTGLTSKSCRDLHPPTPYAKINRNLKRSATRKLSNAPGPRPTTPLDSGSLEGPVPLRGRVLGDFKRPPLNGFSPQPPEGCCGMAYVSWLVGITIMWFQPSIVGSGMPASSRPSRPARTAVWTKIEKGGAGGAAYGSAF